MRQGGGNRFGEDDLAGDPDADALTNNGQGPSITGRLRSAADGAQAAADLVGAGAAGLAAVQAFRSQLPHNAAEYVIAPPRAAAAATTADHRPTRRRRAPPGRGGAARAGGGAWRSTGHRGDGSSGCGGGRGRRRRRGRGRGLRVLGGPGRRSSSPRTHGGRGCWSDGCHSKGWRSGNGGVGRGTRRRRSLRPGPRHGLGAGAAALPSSRASSQSGFRVQAQTNHTPRPFFWGLNSVTVPQSQPNSRASSRSSGRQSQDRGGLDSPSPYEQK